MAILNTGLVKPASGFSIDNSCRFERASPSSLVSSAFTFSQANTLSFWFKRGSLGATSYVYQGDSMYMAFMASNIIEWGREGAYAETTRVFRDTSAWYHFHLKATASATQFYVNGVLDSTITNSATYASTAFTIGATTGLANPFSGYMADFHCVNGLSLDPTSFGEVDEDYGHWKPIKYTGSYGTGGFYLDFKAGANLGNDASGGTDLTETNIAASDQMLDTPANNFCTLNPLYFGNSHLSEGNLLFSSTTNNRGNMATWDIPIGDKYYFEGVLVDVPASGNEAGIGVNIKTTDLTASRGGRSTSYSYFATRGSPDSDIDDWKWVANTSTDLGSQASIGDIVGIAVNRVDHELKMYRNDYLLATITIPSTDDLIPWVGTGGSTTLNRWAVNFGADGTFAGNKTAQGNADENGYGNFYYEPPSGFLALCTKNLSDPTVTPKEHFGIMLYDDGAGAKTFASHGIPAGVGFQPDLVWLKSRGSAYEHELTDAVRGVTKALSTDSTNIESTDSDGLTAFGSDGFTVGTDNNYDDQTGTGMVAWCWKGGNAISGTGDFTQGTIASTCSRNVAAGFSIVSYTGTGSAGTIGHGLSVIPDLVMVKDRVDNTVNDWWFVTSTALTNTTGYVLAPNVSDAEVNIAGGTSYGGGLALTSASLLTPISGSVDDRTPNESGDTYIAYCWHSVEGFSKIGTYAGNGNADGPFVYCGFRPAYLLIKRINAAGQWRVQDDARDTGNPTQETVMYDTTTAAADENPDDFLSNGFKVRTSAGETNNSSGTYVFMAFSRIPLKYANAR